MAEMMDAIVYTGIGKYEFKQIPKARIEKPDEVLLKVEAASICGTDVHILNVPPEFPAATGIALGHEFVGEIIEIGSKVTAFKAGDRVTMDPNIPCGNCYLCKYGHPNLCKNMYVLGTTVNGFFAQYAAAPEKALAKISKKIPAHIAVYAEPLTCVMGGVDKSRLLPGETALVLGAGPIGIYFASLYKANGAAKVIISEVSEYRIAKAKECGINFVINPNEEDLYEAVLKETDGKGADIVTDAIGTQLTSAIQCVRPRGRIILFGANSNAKQTISQFDILYKELSIFGNYIGPFRLLDAIRVLETGIITDTLEKLVTHKLPLRDFGIGLDAMRKGEAMEVVLYPFM
ncbi:MAG: alcohol dehydrogenase catalytic domain-containing protein [Christensenellales bacterium]|jgi:threonine dehydrogenase-like Zn-dependent dehydrogenase